MNGNVFSLAGVIIALVCIVVGWYFSTHATAQCVRSWLEKPLRIAPIVAPHSHRHVVPFSQPAYAFSQELARLPLQEHSPSRGMAIVPGCPCVRYDHVQKQSKKRG